MTARFLFNANPSGPEPQDSRSAVTRLSLILFGLSACFTGCQPDSRGSVPAASPTTLAATGARRASGRQISSVVMPRGTRVVIRLLQAIGSRTVEPQEFFDGELSEAVVADGRTLLPAGGRVRGRVLPVQGSGNRSGSPPLSLRLDALEVAEGEWIYVKTTSVPVRRRAHNNGALAPVAAGDRASGDNDAFFPARTRLVFVIREDQAIDR